MKIAAGIVLYNPDIKRLEKNVNAIINQVDRVFIVNNGEKIAGSDFKGEYGFLKDDKILVINNEKNLGVAKALNQIVEKCISEKYTWVLFLDQDSIAEDGLVEKLALKCDEKNVSIVAPRINDLNKHQNCRNSEEAEDVDMVITSGSLTNVKDCKKLGMFDEIMFIDFVDFDYCKRVKLAGKRIIRINNAELKHEVGKRTKRRFLWMTLYPTNHSSERVYYYGRNLVYYKKKYKNKFSIREKKYLFETKVWKVMSIILYENNKMQKLSKFFEGIRIGKHEMMLPEGVE